MATLTATGYTFTITATYSTSSTNDGYTVTVTKLEVSSSTGNNYITSADVTFGGTTVVSKSIGGAVTSKKTYTGSWSVTKSKTHAAQSLALAVGSSYVQYQGHGPYSISNSTNLSVPAKPSYTVAYNANSHGTAPSSQTKWYGESLTLRSAISASGYTFVRWNTNSANTGTGYAGGGSYTPNSAATLYAIWNRTVSYNANGGSSAPSSQTALATSAITLASAISRSGYAFKQWNTNSNGTGTAYNAGASYAAHNPNVTLYAIWNRTVTYDANGGSTTPTSQTAVSTSSITLSAAIHRDGHAFKEWNTAPDGSGTTYAAGAAYTGATVTLYAIWTPVITAVTLGTEKAVRVDSTTSTVESDGEDAIYAYVEVGYTVSGAAVTATDGIVMTATAEDEDGTSIAVTRGTYTATKGTTEAASGTFTLRINAAMDTDKKYVIAVTVRATKSDGTQYSESTLNVIILPAYFTFAVKAGGHGVSFGAPATQDGFNVSMQTYSFKRECYPLFVYDTKPANSDPPILPCFVLVKSDYGLWYYD